MGRKKSKTSKQKQAKAAASSSKVKNKFSSSFGGVVVHKGGGGGHGQKDRINASSANVILKKDSSSSKNKNGRRRANTKMSMLDQALKGGGGSLNFNRTDEQKDFDKEFASQQERVLRQEQKSTSKRQKNIKKNTAPAIPNLTPATLTLEPKTAAEMVEDATNYVALGMTDIGKQQQQTTAAAPSNLLQVLAAQKRNEWNAQDVQRQRDEEEFQKGRDPNNPFGALGGWQDDSDDEAEQNKTSHMQFAPASFSFGGGGFAQTTTPTQPQGYFEIDPDL
eukprot:339498-Ditylum_brightwellii.AAC.1